MKDTYDVPEFLGKELPPLKFPEESPLKDKASDLDEMNFRRWLENCFRKARVLPFPKYHCEQILVYPWMAKIMMEHNIDNRPPSPSRVRKAKDHIETETFVMISQGISFAKEHPYHLNNGQSRLTACIETDTPIYLNIVFGESREAFKYIDRPGIRTSPDALTILKVEHPRTTAAIVHLLMSQKVMVEEGTRAMKETVSDPSHVVDAYKDEFFVPVLQVKEAIKIAKACGQCGQASIGAGLWYIADRTSNPLKYDPFVDQLVTGLTVTRAIVDYREIMSLRRYRGKFKTKNDEGEKIELRMNTKDASLMEMAMMIKAWNCWVKGQDTRAPTRWEMGTPWPQPL